MNSKSEDTKDKLIFWIGTTTVAFLVAWGAWLTNQVYARPTKTELSEIMQDRKSIEARMIDSVDRNTVAINLLRVEIEKIRRD